MLNRVLTDLTIGIGVSAILLIAGFLFSLGLQWYRERKRRRVDDVSLFTVTKLRSREEGHAPYNVRTHPTLKGAEPTQVWDESVSVSLKATNYQHTMRAGESTTSGTEYRLELFPNAGLPGDLNIHRVRDSGIFALQPKEETFALASVTTRWNGLQSPDEWWYGTTAQYEGENLTLVVDFSLIPNAKDIVQEVTAKTQWPDGTAKQWDPTPIARTIYAASAEGCAKDQLLELRFTLDPSEMTDTGLAEGSTSAAAATATGSAAIRNLSTLLSSEPRGACSSLRSDLGGSAGRRLPHHARGALG